MNQNEILVYSYSVVPNRPDIMHLRIVSDPKSEGKISIQAYRGTDKEGVPRVKQSVVQVNDFDLDDIENIILTAVKLMRAV